ncbi:uncharacterized protein G6M90_00g081450 [Metarhizium brunneum]|uniref:Uncharacterized protein n=1 Tax=Metarhizium brunneum TaxID=500148 RepID=A0A7D5V0U0_9HYPO|nr:hypothetical protein G6M90_00g081450 [Metarhizium brunneum]
MAKVAVSLVGDSPWALEQPRLDIGKSKADFVQKFKDRFVDCRTQFISQQISGVSGYENSNGEIKEQSYEGNEEKSSSIACRIYNAKGDGPVDLDASCEDQEGGCEFCVNKGKSKTPCGEVENWTCQAQKPRMGTEAPGEDEGTPLEWDAQGNLVDPTGRIIHPAQEADKVPKKADEFIGPYFTTGKPN